MESILKTPTAKSDKTAIASCNSNLLVGADKSEIVNKFDVNLEIIETAIYYLEKIIKLNFPSVNLEFISSTDFTDCKFSFYCNLEQVQYLFLNSIPLSYVISKTQDFENNSFNIDLIEVANYFNCSTKDILAELFALRSKNRNIMLQLEASKIMVRASSGVEDRIKNDIALDFYKYLDSLKSQRLKNIQVMYQAIYNLAKNGMAEKFSDLISQYFSSDRPSDVFQQYLEVEIPRYILLM